MRTNTLLRYCFLLIVLFTAACSKPEKPVTKEEATAFSKTLEAAMKRRDVKKFNEVIDINALATRIKALGKGELKSSTVSESLRSLKTGEFGQQIMLSLGKKGTYQLVKQYEKDNHQHLVYRLYNEQLNYHDFELIKIDDQVRAADIFVYTTGQNLSATFAESLLYMNDQPAATSKVDKSDINSIKRIKTYINNQEYEKADRLFKELPAVIKDQRLYKFIYIQIAAGLGTEEYLKTLHKFRQEYPDAPNMYLLMIDAYFLKKDFDGALTCVNQLDSLINKDPFLDYYRSLLYKQKNDQEKQGMCLAQLHKNLPGFADGMVELISYYLDSKQMDKAVAIAKQYKQHKDAEKDVMDGLYVLYPDFKKEMEATAD